jgi:GNAT superfamily N-acetyltransferase
MIANYANDPQLFDRCMNLINAVFPGCEDFARFGMKHNASWSSASTPFIIEEKGEIIAHAGVWPLTMVIDGKEHQSASIHGVCVKPEYRGRGLFKQLMNEAMTYVKTHFDSSVLFTTKPYLYENFPYKVMLPEYDFEVSQKPEVKNETSDIRKLLLDNSDDVKIMQHLLSNRLPLSNQFSIIGDNGKSLFILNTYQKDIYYSKKLNALTVFEIYNHTLFIKEIISLVPLHLNDVIAMIPEKFDKIILQFCPDGFLDEKEYSPILARPECCIMVSETFQFNNKCFRYPELYWC